MFSLFKFNCTIAIPHYPLGGTYSHILCRFVLCYTPTKAPSGLQRGPIIVFFAIFVKMRKFSFCETFLRIKFSWKSSSYFYFCDDIKSYTIFAKTFIAMYANIVTHVLFDLNIGDNFCLFCWAQRKRLIFSFFVKVVNFRENFRYFF
jgi:hypothetical protein